MDACQSGIEEVDILAGLFEPELAVNDRHLFIDERGDGHIHNQVDAVHCSLMHLDGQHVIASYEARG